MSCSPQKLLVFTCLWLLFASGPSHAMIGGEETDLSYSAIGSLRPFDQKNATCTATLINPNWIVTAQHCREGGSEEEPLEYKPEQLFFQIGPDAKKSKEKVPLKKWVSINGSDVAFAELSRAIVQVGSQPIQPIPLGINTRLLADSARYEVVGFGETTTRGYGGPSGHRQKASYEITTIKSGPAFENIFGSIQGFERYLRAAHPLEIEATSGLMFKSEINEKYQVHAWDPRGREKGRFTRRPAQGWSSTCHGDSGGPMIGLFEGKSRVVGIISSGFNGDSEGCIPLGSVISIFGPAVQQAIRAHSIP